MLSDQLRALAEVAMNYGNLVIAGDLRSLADKLQGKVVVRPFTDNCEGLKDCNGHDMWCAQVGGDPYSPPSAWGTTEAEAIANLQAALDAAERGEK